MKLALGTVQFGLNYGISNTVGKVSDHELQQILRVAADAGIALLDTAQAYYSSVITLPLFTELSEAQQDEVVHQLERLL